MAAEPDVGPWLQVRRTIRPRQLATEFSDSQATPSGGLAHGAPEATCATRADRDSRSSAYGERMQFTAHLADLGPSEDHQCEVRGMQLCWGATRSEGELRNRSQKWLTQTRFVALRACAHALQACSTPMTSGYSAMCRTCTRFQCLSCCRGPAGLGVVCGACSSAMCRQCVDSSPSIAAQARFWVRLGMQYASPGSALCLACSHHLTGGKEPCTPLPAKHALPEEPESQRGMASLDGVAPTAPQTDAQPRLGAKRPRVSAT